MPLRIILLDLHPVQHQTLLARNCGPGMSQVWISQTVKNGPPPCIDAENLSKQKEHELRIIKNAENQTG